MNPSTYKQRKQFCGTSKKCPHLQLHPLSRFHLKPVDPVGSRSDWDESYMQKYYYKKKFEMLVRVFGLSEIRF